MDRVRVRDRDRRSEPNLLWLLSSTKTYHISYGGPEHLRSVVNIHTSYTVLFRYVRNVAREE